MCAGVWELTGRFGGKDNDPGACDELEAQSTAVIIFWLLREIWNPET